MEIYEIMMILSSIAIILLLAIQSWILLKLMPLIRTTAHNSTAFKKILGVGESSEFEIPDKKEYPETLRSMGLFHCASPHQKGHIHTEMCL